MANEMRPHFEVHPSVVYQLGESLISDAVQALIELVKNCYDADATYAKVVIDTKGIVDVDGSTYSSEGGRIIVEDDGHGMNLLDIETGWLTISNRKKRELKLAKKTTDGGRTPLGDKGLGRLGVQRLGENLEIFTKAKLDIGYHFGFSWLDFATAPKLEDVDIHLSEVNYPRESGTRIVVSMLKEPNTWHGQTAVKRLEQELSRMISPFRQIRDFTVLVEVDGKRLDLIEISDTLRDIAPVRYTLKFDGSQFTVEGRAKLNFFRLRDTSEAEQYDLANEPDDGHSFFEFMKEKKLAQTIGLSRSSSNKWFVEFRCQKFLADLDKVRSLIDKSGIIANPGPFVGEVDSFDLGESAQFHAAFNRLSDYRRRIKELSGIYVYRDGFAIRVAHDWLKLGAQWTSAPSYYGLKPENTLGYIALSARDNMELEEMTDREGFKDSPYFYNFSRLLAEFVTFTTTSQEFLRRSWNDFRKKRNETRVNIDSRKTVEEISQTIKKSLAEAPLHQKNLDVFKSHINSSVSASKSLVSLLKFSKEITPVLKVNMDESLHELEKLLYEADNVFGQVSTYLSEMDTLRKMEQVIDDRVDVLRQQMDSVYETIALGLTAESLSHEVYNVADQLANRAKSVQSTLRQNGILDKQLHIFIEYVLSSVTALRKQMSFLSPSLRYVREQKHDIDIYVFVTEMAEFYTERFEKNNITMTIKNEVAQPFSVHMNKGKLTQVIDNLVQNSEYWLKEDIAQGRLSAGLITIDISRPFVHVFDNGQGIDSSIEQAIFEPFITAKAKGQGRGLGLFIVKQLLDSEGCSVILAPERNQQKRLYKFRINLLGVLNE